MDGCLEEKGSVRLQPLHLGGKKGNLVEKIVKYNE